MFWVKDLLDGNKTYESRFVVKGFQQNGEVDSPVVRTTIAFEDIHLE